MKIFQTLFIILLLNAVLFSASLPEQLQNDIQDGGLDDFSLIEAALIVSGVEDETGLKTAIDWFHDLVHEMERKNIVVRMEPRTSAERIFMYLHTTWLKNYQLEATTLLDIQEKREFNCVSATVLYNLIGEEVGLETRGFETPTHVYTIFSNFSEFVMVENTTSMGFNIMKNLRKYSEYLAQYYPQKLIYQIGLDRLYHYENSRGREIDNQELIGLICYNQAIFAARKKQFKQAYEHVLLAQQFNEDSRSNQKFEVKLYYDWGRQLFRQQQFFEAFELFSQANWRYPDNTDFARNSVTAFKNALNRLRQQNDWDAAEKLVLEMDERGLLDEKDFKFQQHFLNDWLHSLIARQELEPARRVQQVLIRIYGEEATQQQPPRLIRPRR